MFPSRPQQNNDQTVQSMMYIFQTLLSSSAVPFVGGVLGVGTIPEVNVIDTGFDARKKIQFSEENVRCLPCDVFHEGRMIYLFLGGLQASPR